jgi:DNA-binding NtrC family response regulator
MNKPMDLFMAYCERTYLEALLARHKGKITPAVKEAGRNRTSFYLAIKRHGIKLRDFKRAA